MIFEIEKPLFGTMIIEQRAFYCSAEAKERSVSMELKIEHLSKQFKDKTAVNDVNLTLTPGIWGLFGGEWCRENHAHAHDC